MGVQQQLLLRHHHRHHQFCRGFVIIIAAIIIIIVIIINIIITVFVAVHLSYGAGQPYAYFHYDRANGLGRVGREGSPASSLLQHVQWCRCSIQRVRSWSVLRSANSSWITKSNRKLFYKYIILIIDKWQYCVVSYDLLYLYTYVLVMTLRLCRCVLS